MSRSLTLPNKISTNNVRAASTMAAGAVYQGTGEIVAQYGRAGVSITSDNATDGTLTIEVSRDGVTYGGPTRSWSDTRFAQPHMWEIVEKYFRIKYTNGTTEATNLSIQVQYSNNGNVFLGHELNETLLDETEAIVVRSVGVGQDPNSIYKNFDIGGVDDGNSSTTNLTKATSLVFTGTWSRIDGYSGVSVLVDGTGRGNVAGILKMQFSHDGVTVHRSIKVTNVDIRNVPPRTLGTVAKYFRIIYEANRDLLSFDVQTILHNEQVSLVSRLDQTLQGTEDVSNVRSVLAGSNSEGDFTNAEIDVNRRLKVNAEGIVGILEVLLKEQQLTNAYLKIISGGEIAEIKGGR